MLIGTVFMHRLIRKLFPLEKTLVLWHLPPVVIRTNTKPSYNDNKAQDILENSKNIEGNVENIMIIHGARQIALKPILRQNVMITTIAYGLKTIEPQPLSTSRQ